MPLIPVTELNMKSWSHARSYKQGERGVFLPPCTDREMWKKGYFFSFQLRDIAQKGMFFGGTMLVVQQISTMTFTATDIYLKRCFTFSGYIMF